jgi:hypothetical protein
LYVHHIFCAMTLPPSTAQTKSTQSVNSQTLAPARQIARVMDNLIRVLGTNIGIGLDPILNLIPIAGDAAGTLMSAYLLVTGYRLGVPKRVLMRMMLNIGIDTVVGAIPFFGNIFDFVWKANAKNLHLLEQYTTAPQQTSHSSGVFVGMMLVVLAGLLIGTLWVAGLLLSSLVEALNGYFRI